MKYHDTYPAVGMDQIIDLETEARVVERDVLDALYKQAVPPHVHAETLGGYLVSVEYAFQVTEDVLPELELPSRGRLDLVFGLTTPSNSRFMFGNTLPRILSHTLHGEEDTSYSGVIHRRPIDAKRASNYQRSLVGIFHSGETKLLKPIRAEPVTDRLYASRINSAYQPKQTELR